MTHSRFLQIHTLTSYPASLLNRDDVGFAKRMPFGGQTRTRVSSQCLKRHWRTFRGEHAIGKADSDLSVRSRQTFQRFIVEPLLAEGVDAAMARAVTEAIMVAVLGESAKAKKAKGSSDESTGLETGQIVVLGRPEVDFLLSLARSIAADVSSPDKAKTEAKAALKENKANLRALAHGAGLDAAMFGRMVTSDMLARGDAAVHVAHSFTVHGESTESDYFSAVDDLTKGDQELGSGHIGNTELTSGLYYGYVAVDVPLLVSNLEGTPSEKWQSADRDLAARIVGDLVHLVTKVSPGAKLGSTAPYSYSHLLLVESGSAQPRTLANAFLKPVHSRPDLLGNTYAALANHVGELDQMYGAPSARSWAALSPTNELAATLGESTPGGVSAVAQWAAGQVGA